MSKLLKIIGLGGIIWSISLLWPEVNSPLSFPVMLGLVTWLGTASLFYLLLARQPDRYSLSCGGDRPADRPSRPVPALRN